MPTTRKKVIKTVYKDDDSEGEDGDFSDSGSDAKFSDGAESSSDEEESQRSSGDEFDQKKNCKQSRRKLQSTSRKPKLVKTIINKINKQMSSGTVTEDVDISPALFSVKDLTEADKLLPPILNLSESDSSDDESAKLPHKKTDVSTTLCADKASGSDNEGIMEYKDVWSNNLQDNASEEIAKKTFMELEEHKTKIEEAKASIHNYNLKMASEEETNVKDLLALGEEPLPEKKVPPKKEKIKKKREDSESEIEDWEEVVESKATVPQQGIQLFVEFPDNCRKRKKVDVEMMMKRKINRVKKEYQIYMHKVHVLCWLGHGNYVSRVLNDQEIMAAALALVPSKECYPGERVDMKYVEQVTIWYKDKLTMKQDKHEEKFKPKAPPLKNILLTQINSRVITMRKYLVFIFVSMLRALGLQCRIMFNFVTLPIKPPTSELCSLSSKEKGDESVKNCSESSIVSTKKDTKKKKTCTKTKLPQVDGHYDSECETHSDSDIVQLDGNNDDESAGSRRTRSTKRNIDAPDNNENIKDLLPPKVLRKSPGRKTSKNSANDVKPQGLRSSQRNKDKDKETNHKDNIHDDVKDGQKKPRKNTTPSSHKPVEKTINERKSKSIQRKTNVTNEIENDQTDIKSDDEKITKSDEDVSPPKISRKTTRRSPKPSQKEDKIHEAKKLQENENSVISVPIETKLETKVTAIEDSTSSSTQKKSKRETSKRTQRNKDIESIESKIDDADSNKQKTITTIDTTRRLISQQNKVDSGKTKDNKSVEKNVMKSAKNKKAESNQNNFEDKQETKFTPPKLTVTDVDNVPSIFFSKTTKSTEKKVRLSRNRTVTANISSNSSEAKPKARTKSAPDTTGEKSKYFNETTPKTNSRKLKDSDDKNRVSHRDLAKVKLKADNDVTDDLVDILKKRIKIAKDEAKKGIVKEKNKMESDEDSDYLPVEDVKRRQSGSDNDFKPIKLSPRPSTSRKIDRRVLSSDDEIVRHKIDVWCEIFVEELEQWVSVDVIKGKMHDVNTFYTNATHPVCYVVGWDNNNYLKDLTRKYVPHWNTVTRKQRAESPWWDIALKPWLGPKTAKDREEDEYLDRMQMEAPLPKSIAEYKNHPLYALQRHLLKFEAIYPPDAAVLGFVRQEPVYARECVYVCRSRDTWLKEAKVVKLGEKPYKVVKARPKWDKLSNKVITDKPLEVFGPWQVQEYEPPVAENGIVPRNAYGNVELFKECMLPKGTVHLKLPGLNRVARKLNIDCAPAMTGFDFNGGWSHPVYDGFVVCEEFGEIVTDAWVKDQEEQEKREREKMEARVYGNWKRLIKGLLIRERLKDKYGFEEPAPTQNKGKAKGPRFVAKKKS